MKIAFVHFYTLRLRRGIETLVLSLSNALALKGHAVTILTAQRTLSPSVKPLPQVQLYEFPTYRYKEEMTIVPFYGYHLLRHDYDAVVIFFADFGEAAAIKFVQHFKPIHLVLCLCYPYAAAPHRYHSFQKSGLTKLARCVCADSDYVARDAESFLGCPVQVVPAGTDPVRFRPDPGRRNDRRSRYGISDEEIVLLNVSNLEERKGVQRVLEALSKVKHAVPAVRYLIMGEGPMRQTLEEMTRQRGLERNVIFGSVTTDLVPYYNAADIFVMLSDDEANSIACLEAMACGLPVIATRGGGFQEVIDPTCGFLIERGDEAGFISAVERLAKDKTLRLGMGAEGRAKVLAHYSWERIAEKALDVFSCGG